MVEDITRRPVLLTKLQPPAPGFGQIIRPRLNEQLDIALNYPTVLIIAPAGYGKTTCLTAYFSDNPSKFAWLSLDNADNDPVHFWTYFIAALNQVFPDISQNVPVTLPGLGINYLPGGLDELCNQLVAIPQNIVFVLDDFQHISHPDIHLGMSYLIDHAPANFHLLFSSRKKPGISLSRLRAKNRLFEINTSDLAFLDSETRLFFEKSGNKSVDDKSITRVTGLTRGWAAGIRMIEIAFRDTPNYLDAMQEGQKLAVEYVMNEIIAQISDDLKDFMGNVAILDSFTVESATAITKISNAEALIQQIIQANLFLNSKSEIYQFHPFFREALLQMLPLEEFRLAHQRAGVWYESQSMPEKAIVHFLAAEEWESVIRLITALQEKQLRNGEIHTLEGWLLLIPEAIRNLNPDLLVLQGWVWYLSGKIPEIQAIIQFLELPENENRIHNKGFWAGLRCQLALVQEQNRLALDLALLALQQINENYFYLRGILLASKAAAQQALGKSDDAILSFRQSIEVNSRAGNLLMATFSLVSLGLELNEQGQRQQALVLCEDALADSENETGNPNPIIGIVYVLLARLYWEADRLDEALEAVDISSARLNQLGIPGFQISADLVRAMILESREEFSEARNLINKNRHRTKSGEFVGFHQIFNMLRVEIALKTGDIPIVNEWLEGSNLPATPHLNPAREMEFVLKARILLETSNFNQADQILSILNEYTRDVHHKRAAIAVTLLRATWEWKKGHLGQVKVLLEEALALAAPDRYIRLLLDYGQPLLGIIAQMPGAPVEIRSRFQLSQPAHFSGNANILTARELDVFRLLAEQNTNLEIASQLFLSAETVKIHIKHIFQKLEVNDRRQAVRRGRELELI